MEHLALVTGASSGIGFELARYAAHKDYDLSSPPTRPRSKRRLTRFAMKARKSRRFRRTCRSAKAWTSSTKRSAPAAVLSTRSSPMQDGA